MTSITKKRLFLTTCALVMLLGGLFLYGENRDKQLGQLALYGAIDNADVHKLEQVAKWGYFNAYRTLAVNYQASAQKRQLDNRPASVTGGELARTLSKSEVPGDRELAIQLWLTAQGCHALTLPEFQKAVSAVGGINRVGRPESSQVEACSRSAPAAALKP